MIEYIKSKEELEKYFKESYYNSINYGNYLNRTNKYLNTAKDIIEFMNIKTTDSILDYGCAVGHLLYGFQSCGLKNLYGVDISSWAIKNSPYDGLKLSNNIESIKDYKYSLCTVLDVFEHMFDEQIHLFLENLSTNKLIVRIPCKLKDENDFHLSVSRKDPSHVNCKTKEDWIDLFLKFNYKFSKPIVTKSIYDSDGCFCGVFVR